MFQTRHVEKIKTRILHSINFFPENPAVYEIMWINTVDPDRPQMTIWRWIPRATNRHSVYIMLIAFQLQRWLHERALMLRL
jgi:hypothetical protein